MGSRAKGGLRSAGSNRCIRGSLCIRCTKFRDTGRPTIVVFFVARKTIKLIWAYHFFIDHINIIPFQRKEILAAGSQDRIV